MYANRCEVIPGGVNSPVRAFKGMGVPPLVAEKALGDELFDKQGKSYIDYCCSWGALIHGHANPEILLPVIDRLRKGTTFGLSSEIEEKLAREVTRIVPSIEMVRFVSSGTEAAMSAVRLARGYTGRNIIIKFDGNYHGHADLFLVKAGSAVAFLPESSSLGVPPGAVAHTISLPYNNPEIFLEYVRNHEVSRDVAAVIVEPIAGNMGVVPADNEFLRLLREETERMGALLIFDEVISGFRVGLHGAQGHFGIQPDLTCLGKIIGGGFPAAAFGGSREIMGALAPQGGVFQAGTLSGNPVAMEAGYQALRLAQFPDFYLSLKKKADRIIVPVREYLEQNSLNACIQEAGSMFTLFLGKQKVENFEHALQCDNESFAAFFRHMIQKGIFIPPSQHEAWFISSAHTDQHLDYTTSCILEFLTGKI